MELRMPKTDALSLWLGVSLIAWIGVGHACADDQRQSLALDEAICSISEIRGVHGLVPTRSRNPGRGCVMGCNRAIPSEVR